MAATLGVHIVGDAVGLKTALAEATAATEKYAATSKAAFAGVSDASLQAQIAQYRLGKATEKYGATSVGAAQATLAHRRQVEALRESHLRTAQSIGRGLTTYVTAPTALLGFEAVKMGIEFQRQMLLIQTQAGASASEVKNLTGQVLRLAPAVGMGPTELAQGLYHLESLGLRGTKAMQTLKISSLAAGMGVANLEDVSTALGGAVVTNIKGAENYQKAMATLVATVGAGNMRFGDLAGSIGNVAPAAAAAGISLPELGASMAVLTDRGLSADEAATRLRMTFALLQAPSAKAKKALKDLGIDADSLAGTLRSPGGLGKVLTELHDAIGRVGQARGNRDLIQAFGGGRSSLGVQILVQSLTNQLSGYQRKLEDVSAGEQKYARNQKAYMDSAAFKLAQDWAEAKTRLTQFGADLAPVAVKAVQAVGIIGDEFAKLPRSVQHAVGGIIGLLAVGGPLILTIVGARRMIGTLTTAFRLMPLQAGPAIAATDAEIASLGSTAVAAEGKISLLRGGLLGLAAFAAAPIVIDVVRHFINDKTPYGSAAVPSKLGVAPKGDTNAETHGEITKQGGQFYWHRGGRYYPISGKQAAALGATNPAFGITSTASTAGMTRNEMEDRGSRPRAFTSPAHIEKAAPRKSSTPPTAHPHDVSKPPKAPPQFSIPFSLQLEQARAGLTKGNADDKKALRDIIANAKQQIATFKAGDPRILDAINAESAALQQLWGFETTAAKKHTEQLKKHKKKAEAASAAYSKVSAEAFTAGLGLDSSTRKSLEERYAQIQAHGGYVPNGTAAQGQVIIENHTHIHGDLNGLVSKVEHKQRQKHQRSGSRR